MKNTLILCLCSIVFGAVLYYIMTARIITTGKKPPVKVEKTAPQKVYNEDEVKAKIEFQKKQTELSHTWRELITVEKSGGKQLGIAGGFEDVTIRVKNETDYLINEATVQINIYRGLVSNKLCNSEDVKIYNIPPKAEKSIPYTFRECGQDLKVLVIGYSCHEMETGE